MLREYIDELIEGLKTELIPLWNEADMKHIFIDNRALLVCMLGGILLVLVMIVIMFHSNAMTPGYAPADNYAWSVPYGSPTIGVLPDGSVGPLHGAASSV